MGILDCFLCRVRGGCRVEPEPVAPVKVVYRRRSVHLFMKCQEFTGTETVVCATPKISLNAVLYVSSTPYMLMEFQ